jgi:hypothetical protein
MKRMLRFDEESIRVTDEKQLVTSEDVEFINNCSLGQLEEYQKLIETEIEKRLALAKGLIEIKWEGYWDANTVTKKPYLATLSPNYEFSVYKRYFEMNFLPLNRVGSKFFFRAMMKYGTVLKGRVQMGSDHYYKVTSNGLEEIQLSDVLKIINEKKNKK